MQKFIAAAVAALAVIVPAHAADTYTIDPSHTFPRFEISHLGYSTHRGQFNKTAGSLVLDRKAGTGSIDITVDTASISTGDAKLEEHLRGADFFNVAKFPTMTFKSKALKFDGGVPVQATGELTLLGVTKPLTLALSRVKCGPHPMLKDKEVCGAEVGGKLQRSAFGMKTFVPAVGDEVTLHIQVEAFKN